MNHHTPKRLAQNAAANKVREELTFGSLFSGCGGFDKSLEDSGMRCLWQVEIDKQCQGVLRRHWDVALYDDVRRVRAYLEPKNAKRTAVRPERPDVLCGGFPCQDISVAGRRAGLAGSRSGLWFTFRRIAALIRPRWLLIENVDGLRSSNGGRDLGAILKALGDMGYGWSYRVFDSQWFGLAQRRERVFIVGCFGDWRRSGEVLFERDCLPWNPAPSRETGARVAASLKRGSARGRGVNAPGRRREDDTNLALCLNAKGGCGRIDGESENFIPVGALASHSREHGHAMTTQQAAESGQLVAFYSNESQSSGNNDNISPTLKVGKELNVPTSPAIAYAIQERAGAVNDTSGPGGKGWQEDIGYTLESRHHCQSIAFDERNITSKHNRSRAEPGLPCHTLHSDAPRLASRHAVRRLTPRECERLQGFPDDWTRWDADGNELADSPRYRMMGNAVSIPPVTWIGRRIVANA